VQGEKRHFQPIARLFVIKKKVCGFSSRLAAISQPASGGAVFLSVPDSWGSGSSRKKTVTLTAKAAAIFYRTSELHPAALSR
jgi:hypothetical protein